MISSHAAKFVNYSTGVPVHNLQLALQTFICVPKTEISGFFFDFFLTQKNP